MFVPRLARAGSTEALLLSCMDYRLLDDIVRYMDGRGMTDKYDHVILAGGGLGAVTGNYPDWNKTFWDHVDLAVKLHSVHRVITLDHRDCGAYKVIFNQDFAADPAKETQIHTDTLAQLSAQIRERHPTLETESLLMSLDGTVETIG
jgi:carbonic anhydrase